MEPPSDDLYIIVPKWERFQHYRERDPVWIKVYVKLLHDAAYRQLSLASKGLLQVLWLAYAAEKGNVSVGDARSLVGRSSGLAHQLISLNDAGFIELSASRLLATQEETETEEETEEDFLKKEKKRKKAGVCPQCGVGGGYHTADCPTITSNPELDR